MTPRFSAIGSMSHKTVKVSVPKEAGSIESFGQLVFGRQEMQQRLPKQVCKNLIAATEGKEKIAKEYADTIAVAIKEWAVSHGATHYCHWFQPLNGASAEKHDAFIDWSDSGNVIERFSGQELLCGEPDASSFPSGGLRSTYEARGYTGWDPTSPVFIWQGGDGNTLCIPSIFFSWTGAVLDNKIPLIRSDRKLKDACLRLLKMTGIDAANVYTTLGCEQEYFIIDRSLKNLRQDLVLTDRTVVGNPPSKGQQLQDHYFASVKDRVLAYMRDFEESALQIGIPVKTRHNEVAPAQHEVAPVFERATVAVDHNILLMELMRQTAVKHGLSCLLHEKPFHDLNGSGKHCNWSLSTDTGINLLNPTDTPENNFHFLILLAAILEAIYKHAALLRASIGSAANDYRLGGHEAPPAIISVYLGDALEDLLNQFGKKGASYLGKEKLHHDLHLIPPIPKDNTDRNRTSPFAFTGNKFEFRAVGGSASPALPITVLNTIVAESLSTILDQIDEIRSKHKTWQSAAIQVLQESFKRSKPIRFSGDNYSEQWLEEAKKRGLPILSKSVQAFEYIKTPSTVKAFKGILTAEELKSRYEVMLETYISQVNIEINVLLDVWNTQIMPVAIEYQKHLAKSIDELKDAIDVNPKMQKQRLKAVYQEIEQAALKAEELQNSRNGLNKLKSDKQAQKLSTEIMEIKDSLRESIDKLEMLVDDKLWPLPKYRELLFLV